MARVLRTGVTAAALLWLLPAAFAQPLALNPVNFDLWCQENRHYPAERCNRRTAEDNAEFEAYVDKIQRYEVPYQKGQQSGAQLNRLILHNDPVDHPVTQDPAAAQQEPVTPAQHQGP